MPLSTTTSASQGREPLVLAEGDLLDLSLGVEAALPAALTPVAARGRSAWPSVRPGRQPSTLPPSAGECDSPKVVSLNRVPNVLDIKAHWMMLWSN